jgi:hypothetical protein
MDGDEIATALRYALTGSDRSPPPTLTDAVLRVAASIEVHAAALEKVAAAVVRLVAVVEARG